MHRSSVAIGAAGLLLLSGCAALPSSSNSPSPSASASASAGPVGPAVGDVAPRESVTDEFGTYLHVTLDPASALATQVDPETLDDSIEGSSWDESSILEAQRFVGTFVAEQVIDSTALDRDLAGWEEWEAANSERFFGPEVEGQLSKPENGSDRPTPIFNDPDDFTPRLVRDGLPRLDDAEIVITGIENDPREGGEWLSVSGTSDVAYRVTDEEAIAALQLQGYDADILAGFPALADGEDGHYLVRMEWTYEVERDGDGWIIRDYDFVWDATVEGISQA
jgi:hypothetical protein